MTLIKDVQKKKGSSTVRYIANRAWTWCAHYVDWAVVAPFPWNYHEKIWLINPITLAESLLRIVYTEYCRRRRSRHFENNFNASQFTNHRGMPSQNHQQT